MSFEKYIQLEMPVLMVVGEIDHLYKIKNIDFSL